MSRWFRYYDDALNDPKVQRLSGDLFKAWINLLCLASKGDGTFLELSEVAFALRTSEEKATIILTQLSSRGLFDLLPTGGFTPHNWDKRQFKSDVTDPTAPLRMRNYRNRKRNASVTVTPTRTETETDTEAETESKKEKQVSALSAAREKPERKKPSKSIPDDWRGSNELRQFARSKGLYDRRFDLEMEKFRNHARMHDRKCVKWDMAARNWLLTAIEKSGITPPRPMGEMLADAKLVHVKDGSPEMDAWDRYWRQSKGVNAPRSKHGGIFVDTQWPPGCSEVEKAS